MYSDALKLSKEERLERYSFLKRCSVNIARSLERERRIFANSYNPKPSATRLQPKNQSKRNKAPKSSVKVKKTGTGASSDASSAQNSQSSRVTFLNDESSSESSDSGSDIEEIVATLATEPFEITSINNQSKTALCKNAPKKSKKELSIENAGTFLGRKTTTKCKPVVALGKEFTSVSDLEKIVDTVVQSSVEKLEDLDKSKLCERDERTSNKTEEDEVSAVFGAHDEGVSSSAIKGGVSESVIIGKEPEHDSSSGFDEDQTKSSTSNSEISVKSYKADEVSLNANRILSQTPSEDAVSSIEIDAIVLESESSKSSRQNQVKNKNQIIIAQEKSHEALETIQETQLEPVERDSLATEEKSMIDKPGPLILPSAKNNKPLKRRTNVLSSNSIISSGGAFKKPSFKMPRFTKAASQSEESRSSQENEKSEKTCLSVPTKLNVSVSQTQSSSQVSSDSSAFQKAPLLDKSEALPDELVSTLDDLLSQSQEILSQVSSQEKSQNARSTSKSGSQQDLIRDIDELITSQESLVGSVSEKHHEKLACEE